jgi:hypothetical protein
MSVVRFAKRMSSGPPPCTSASRGLVFDFYFLRDQGVIRLTLRVLGLIKTPLLKTFVDCPYGKYFF